jgi:DNA-binding CsgD family transcriptional regulator
VRLAWPLTGRSEEMRLIEAAISDPDSCGVVVCGAAGVGKSRVAREALNAAASNGYEARWVVGTSSSQGVPLGAFAVWVASVAEQNPQIVQLVRGVIEALTSVRPGTAVIVGIDDVHLLDELSIFVLQQIVERGAAKLVLTVRDGERIPAGVQDITRAASFDRLDMQTLSREETTTLVSAALGGALDPEAARRLWELTRGNVLYLRNIVEQEVADKRLVQHNGLWRWTGAPVIAPGLVELIESRIGALPRSVSDVIDVLAVGEPIELASLGRITDPAAVEEADIGGLITLDKVDGRMEARVAHPLYGEVRRTRAAPTRLRRLRGLVASELATSDDRDDMRIVVRRAELSLESDLDPDPDLLTRAAQGAVSLADMPLADRLADAAIRAGAGAEAYFIRAWPLAWLNPQELDSVLARTPTVTEDDLLRLGAHRAINRLWGLADPDGAKEIIDDMARVDSEQTRSWVDSVDIIYRASMAQPQAAIKAAESIILDQLPAISGAAASWALTVAYGDVGRTNEAVAVADTGYAIVTRTRDAPHLRYLIGDKHVGALWQSGRINEACSVAERLREQAADLPGVAQLLGTAIAGRAALGAGRLDEACSLLEAVIEPFYASGDVNGFGYRYEIVHATALAIRGLTERAAAALTHLEQNRYQSCQFVDYERVLAHAWVAASQGAVSEAKSYALTAAETARANGQFAAEVVCSQTATQFGDSSRAARLRELEAVAEGPRVHAAARFATALERSDADELSAAAELFEHIGDLPAALDAASHAAVVYRGQGLRGSALRCAARADVLAQRCGAMTPALRQGTEPVPLTNREREIVMLLARGLSNKDVAARLTLSVRTVEGHIYRAMMKTGTSTREDLVAVLPQRRLD